MEKKSLTTCSRTHDVMGKTGPRYIKKKVKRIQASRCFRRRRNVTTQDSGLNRIVSVFFSAKRLFTGTATAKRYLTAGVS